MLADEASALMKSFFGKRREGDTEVEKPVAGRKRTESGGLESEG